MALKRYTLRREEVSHSYPSALRLISTVQVFQLHEQFNASALPAIRVQQALVLGVTLHPCITNSSQESQAQAMGVPSVLQARQESSTLVYTRLISLKFSTGGRTKVDKVAPVATGTIWFGSARKALLFEGQAALPMSTSKCSQYGRVSQDDIHSLPQNIPAGSMASDLPRHFCGCLHSFLI